MSIKKSEWVSASDVGQAVACSKCLEKKYRGTEVISEQRQQAREFGDMKHDQFNKEIKSKDTRCFIASHVYGIDHPKTEVLRQFRDSELMKSAVGRVAVSLYYKVSPSFVKLCRRFSLVDLFFRFTVERVVGFLSRGKH